MPAVSINDIRAKINARRPALPASILEMMKTQRVYIYNVGPWQHAINLGSLGQFVVPKCEAGEEYSKPVEYSGENAAGPGIPAIVPESLVDAVEGYDVTYKWDLSTSGQSVALNIMGLSGFAQPSANLTQYGVFIASGKIPTDVEVEQAKAKLEALYDKRVKDADAAFEVNGGTETGENGKVYNTITADHIQAANALGLDREWARKNTKKVPCGACDRPVSPNAVRCHHEGCGAILNEEKARKMFPHLYAHEEKEPEVEGEPRQKRSYTRRNTEAA